MTTTASTTRSRTRRPAAPGHRPHLRPWSRPVPSDRTTAPAPVSGPIAAGAWEPCVGFEAPSPGDEVCGACGWLAAEHPGGA